MTDSTLWGLAVLVFVLPYGFWYFSHLESIEIRKKLYPGNSEVQKSDSRATVIGIAWAASFALLLLLWALEAHPIPSLLGSVFVFGLAAASTRLLRSKALLRSRKIRAQVAVVALWLLSVAAWYAGFGHRADFEASELVALVLAPPVLLLGAVALYGWVRKGVGDGEA